MGIFSRLGKGDTEKKASDDVLLVLGMFMMLGADGMVENGEIAMIESYFNTLPEFRGKDFQTLIVESQKIFNRYGGNSRNAVNALKDIKSDAVRKKCFVVATDIALSSGDVDEAEDQLLEAMQRILEVNDDLARQTIEVLQLKYLS